MRSFSVKSLAPIVIVASAMLQLGCSSQSAEEQDNGGSGTGGGGGSGGAGSAGKTSSGGAAGSGGTSGSSGFAGTGAAGAGATGGSLGGGAGSSSGGAGSSSGGAGSSSGGAGSGGAGSGGAGNAGAGGVSAGAGGVSAGAGGASAGAGGVSAGAGGGAGGPPGTINWGKEEDPTAACPVTGTLPDYAALKADGKLPDPFTKLDGTRIKDKSEWACRRAEIVKQLAKYIYGEKPIPPKGSVTGTVSTTQISVKVTEGTKSTSFTAKVDMNGATAPAPAILIYDGGLGSSLPIPSGVAKITFTATEASGGSGNKTGPFFTYYGATHPAGYMVAQAWQVSRIIDLLEANPGTIDPYHIGVTGCSRNGKGAFAGGLFDNRVALTIPCESGIGGTVGLRLKEQLDPGTNDKAEWPYHAISYVRWLSEVSLGPFATANDANGDNTDKLPVDMHEAMALIAPRAIYIVDNPGITNLDPKSAYVTGMAGKAIFTALGVADHFAYQGAGGDHCVWRSQYSASLTAMIDRFLRGKDTTMTGNFATDLGSKPTATQYYTWDTTELPGTL